MKTKRLLSLLLTLSLIATLFIIPPLTGYAVGTSSNLDYVEWFFNGTALTVTEAESVNSFRTVSSDASTAFGETTLPSMVNNEGYSYADSKNLNFTSPHNSHTGSSTAARVIKSSNNSSRYLKISNALTEDAQEKYGSYDLITVVGSNGTSAAAHTITVYDADTSKQIAQKVFDGTNDSIPASSDSPIEVKFEGLSSKNIYITYTTNQSRIYAVTLDYNVSTPSITLDKQELNLTPGGSYTLQPTVKNFDDGYTVSYAMKDGSASSISVDSSGLITVSNTARVGDKGTVVATCTDGSGNNETATCTVTVIAPYASYAVENKTYSSASIIETNSIWTLGYVLSGNVSVEAEENSSFEGYSYRAKFRAKPADFGTDDLLDKTVTNNLTDIQTEFTKSTNNPGLILVFDAYTDGTLTVDFYNGHSTNANDCGLYRLTSVKGDVTATSEAVVATTNGSSTFEVEAGNTYAVYQNASGGSYLYGITLTAASDAEPEATATPTSTPETTDSLTLTTEDTMKSIDLTTLMNDESKANYVYGGKVTVDYTISFVGSDVTNTQFVDVIGADAPAVTDTIGDSADTTRIVRTKLNNNWTQLDMEAAEQAGFGSSTTDTISSEKDSSCYARVLNLAGKFKSDSNTYDYKQELVIDYAANTVAVTTTKDFEYSDYDTKSGTAYNMVLGDDVAKDKLTLVAYNNYNANTAINYSVKDITVTVEAPANGVDSGTYTGSDGETQYGVIRYLQEYNGVDPSEYGFYFVDDQGNILKLTTDSAKDAQITGNGTISGGFYGDLYDITEGNYTTDYYALPYVTIDGNVYKAAIITGQVGDSPKELSSYNPQDGTSTGATTDTESGATE